MSAAITFAAITLAAGLSALALPPRPPAHSLVIHGKTKALATGQTIPVNGPRELAVDTAGNLYVANSGSNDVVVYNASFTQQTSRTISNGVLAPTGVAVDPYGNVFVCNPYANGYGQVNEYNRSGALSATFSTGLSSPTNIAVDALDDLYVVNNLYTSISVFLKDGILAASSPAVSTLAPNIASVAVSGTNLILSTASFNLAVTNQPYTGYALVLAFDADSVVQGSDNGTLAVPLVPNTAWASGSAIDSSGGFWYSDVVNGAIIHTGPNGKYVTSTIFATLKYAPTGITVDSVRGRIYVSDFFANQIHVYNAQTGALLATIR